MYTHLSLFSGIGGLDLAAEMAGFTTVGQCEWADFQTKVLEKHWPDVPRWRDIRTLTGDDFYNRTGLRTVDVISGGFPCQPFSVAGKQKGKEDERFLWPEMCRVIRELKPHFVVGENVPGILRIAAADVVADLEREGYNAVVFDFEAAAVGAHHRRERVFFVGERKSWLVENAGRRRRLRSKVLQEQQRRAEFERRGETISDADNDGFIAAEKPGSTDAGSNWSTEGQKYAGKSSGFCATVYGEFVANSENGGESRQFPCRREARRLGSVRRWAAEPELGRVAHGVPDRVDRIKSLGNAVVPQQAYPIFKAIMEVLNEERFKD